MECCKCTAESLEASVRCGSSPCESVAYCALARLFHYPLRQDIYSLNTFFFSPSLSQYQFFCWLFLVEACSSNSIAVYTMQIAWDQGKQLGGSYIPYFGLSNTHRPKLVINADLSVRPLLTLYAVATNFLSIQATAAPKRLPIDGRITEQSNTVSLRSLLGAELLN